MAFKIVFTPRPTLKYEAGRKERFIGMEHGPMVITQRKSAESTLEILQKRGSTDGVYKIVPADYQLKDV